jgi:hypothetical protein
MQQVIAYKWCDHPVCQDEWKDRRVEGNLISQDVREMELFIYTPGRGKKPPIIRIELCEQHEKELKEFFSAVFKYNMNKP